MSRALSLLFPAGCLCFAILLGLPGAIYAPDAGYYRLLALGQRAAVPAPFSARILGPAIAGSLGRGLGVDTGFLVLGIACLAGLLALMAALLWSWKAPAIFFAGVFLMPFWIDLFHDYYLPDLLHATILASILLCLLFGHTGLALLLLLPAYLARESTVLVAVCLLVAGWRRIPVRTVWAGFLALLAGGLISRHYGQGGPASVHGITGGEYIFGKFFWSFFKNVLGLPLWSNTLQECRPLWSTAIPHGLPLGAIQAIGFCQPDSYGPGRLLLAWFGIFGIGPALALALRRRIISPAPEGSGERTPGLTIVLRFSIVYGAISLLLTPLLGASVDRLVEYGWPFYFVALPWFLLKQLQGRANRSLPFLLLHLLTCWFAWFSFRQYGTSALLPGLTVLALNGLCYGLVKRYCPVS
jgi:hypothetical protein